MKYLVLKGGTKSFSGYRYPEKLFFGNNFSHKQEWRKSITYRPTRQVMFKVIEAEGRWKRSEIWIDVKKGKASRKKQ